MNQQGLENWEGYGCPQIDADGTSLCQEAGSCIEATTLWHVMKTDSLHQAVVTASRSSCTHPDAQEARNEIRSQVEARERLRQILGDWD